VLFGAWYGLKYAKKPTKSDKYIRYRGSSIVSNGSVNTEYRSLFTSICHEWYTLDLNSVYPSILLLLSNS